MAKPGPRNDLTDIAGLRVGHAVDAKARTGTTVVVTDSPAIAAVDVRGGGACTRETDVMNPGGLVEAVDAICLSGGSVYGLGAADGVCAALGAEGRGYGLMPAPGVPNSPIVPAACLYDLANGGDKAWGTEPPYRQLGLEAYANARAGDPVALGRVGAGLGAMAGSHPGAIGSASLVTEDGFAVAALVAVNCFGSVRVPNSDAFWSYPFEIDGEFGGARPEADWTLDPEDWGDAKVNPGARTQTTLAVIATDADLNRDEARRFCVMGQDGLARAIRPVHAPFDGDVVYALGAAGRQLGEDMRAFNVARLGNLAADCLARAVARGVHVALGQSE
ncbi:P1 family peptidase [Maricaulaceae bacterium EIL42A08]|nr:P1 family peptidase [Maricaulaceae bacterium EIL42A08]